MFEVPHADSKIQNSSLLRLSREQSNCNRCAASPEGLSDDINQVCAVWVWQYTSGKKALCIKCCFAVVLLQSLPALLQMGFLLTSITSGRVS
jgi:hypothetical protein